MSADLDTIIANVQRMRAAHTAAHEALSALIKGEYSPTQLDAAKARAVEARFEYLLALEAYFEETL